MATIILFTALMLGFFLLFLMPGRWWPRRSPADPPLESLASHEDDGAIPPPGSTISLN